MAEEGKKKIKKKKSSRKWLAYQIAGNKLERKNKSCPKCSSGIFMAKHKDRWVCGSCSYTEFTATNKE